MRLPTPLPATTTLLLQDYQQRVVSVACPRCVYTALRSEQLSLHPNVDIEAWA